MKPKRVANNKCICDPKTVYFVGFTVNWNYNTC